MPSNFIADCARFSHVTSHYIVVQSPCVADSAAPIASVSLPVARPALCIDTNSYSYYSVVYTILLYMGYCCSKASMLVHFIVAMP